MGNQPCPQFQNGIRERSIAPSMLHLNEKALHDLRMVLIFPDKLIKEGKRKLARKFNLSYRYIDDLISFNNKRFKEFISDIYPKELTF